LDSCSFVRYPATWCRTAGLDAVLPACHHRSFPAVGFLPGSAVPRWSAWVVRITACCVCFCLRIALPLLPPPGFCHRSAVAVGSTRAFTCGCTCRGLRYRFITCLYCLHRSGSFVSAADFSVFWTATTCCRYHCLPACVLLPLGFSLLLLPPACCLPHWFLAATATLPRGSCLRFLPAPWISACHAFLPAVTCCGFVSTCLPFVSFTTCTSAVLRVFTNGFSAARSLVSFSSCHHLDCRTLPAQYLPFRSGLPPAFWITFHLPDSAPFYYLPFCLPPPASLPFLPFVTTSAAVLPPHRSTTCRRHGFVSCATTCCTTGSGLPPFTVSGFCLLLPACHLLPFTVTAGRSVTTWVARSPFWFCLPRRRLLGTCHHHRLPPPPFRSLPACGSGFLPPPFTSPAFLRLPATVLLLLPFCRSGLYRLDSCTCHHLLLRFCWVSCHNLGSRLLLPARCRRLPPPASTSFLPAAHLVAGLSRACVRAHSITRMVFSRFARTLVIWFILTRCSYSFSCVLDYLLPAFLHCHILRLRCRLTRNAGLVAAPAASQFCRVSMPARALVCKNNAFWFLPAITSCRVSAVGSRLRFCLLPFCSAAVLPAAAWVRLLAPGFSAVDARVWICRCLASFLPGSPAADLDSPFCTAPFCVFCHRRRFRRACLHLLCRVCLPPPFRSACWIACLGFLMVLPPANNACCCVSLPFLPSALRSFSAPRCRGAWIAFALFHLCRSRSAAVGCRFSCRFPFRSCTLTLPAPQFSGFAVRFKTAYLPPACCRVSLEFLPAACLPASFCLARSLDQILVSRLGADSAAASARRLVLPFLTPAAFCRRAFAAAPAARSPAFSASAALPFLRAAAGLGTRCARTQDWISYPYLMPFCGFAASVPSCVCASAVSAWIHLRLPPAPATVACVATAMNMPFWIVSTATAPRLPFVLLDLSYPIGFCAFMPPVSAPYGTQVLGLIACLLPLRLSPLPLLHTTARLPAPRVCVTSCAFSLPLDPAATLPHACVSHCCLCLPHCVLRGTRASRTAASCLLPRFILPQCRRLLPHSFAASRYLRYLSLGALPALSRSHRFRWVAVWCLNRSAVAVTVLRTCSWIACLEPAACRSATACLPACRRLSAAAAALPAHPPLGAWVCRFLPLTMPVLRFCRLRLLPAVSHCLVSFCCLPACHLLNDYLPASRYCRCCRFSPLPAVLPLNARLHTLPATRRSLPFVLRFCRLCRALGAADAFCACISCVSAVYCLHAGCLVYCAPAHLWVCVALPFNAAGLTPRLSCRLRTCLAVRI